MSVISDTEKNHLDISGDLLETPQSEKAEETPKGRKRRGKAAAEDKLVEAKSAEERLLEDKPCEASAEQAQSLPASPPLPPLTLAIDIGGTGIKCMVLDAEGKPVGERRRQPTPRPATPQAVLACIKEMLP